MRQSLWGQEGAMLPSWGFQAARGHISTGGSLFPKPAA